MKLRIRGNSIRLRLVRSEVAALVEDGKVEEATEFGVGQRMEYALRTSGDVSSPCATFRAGRIEVLLPTRLAKDWAASQEVGISGDQPLGDKAGDSKARSLSLLIEKDFACIKPPASEDQSDAFPHPGPQCATDG